MMHFGRGRANGWIDTLVAIFCYGMSAVPESWVFFLFSLRGIARSRVHCSTFMLLWLLTALGMLLNVIGHDGFRFSSMPLPG